MHEYLDKSVIHDFYFQPIESYFNNIKIPKCCSKIPPMQVIGILENDTLYVHNYNCELLNNIDNTKVKKVVLH